MKKNFKYILCCLILIVSYIPFSINAQTPQSRSKSTIVADVLAQLPADNQKQYNQLMTDLVSTGEEGLLNLIGKFNPPGNKSNETIDYAISAWTNFVANDNAKRSVAANAYEKALGQSYDNEIKATIIRQLEKIGGDDNVDVLSTLLKDERLIGPASQALSKFNSDAAGSALLNGLKSTTNETFQIQLVNALSQTNNDSAEPVLLGLLSKSTSPVLEKVIYDALANTGSKMSVEILRKAAEKVGYSYTKSNATQTYITLLSKLITSEPKLVEKEAKNLLSVATKQKKSDLSLAANELLFSLSNTNKVNLFKNVLKTADPVTMTNLLNTFSFEKNNKVMDLVQKSLSPKASPSVQAAILYSLGNKKIASAVSTIINYLNSSDLMVQKAAISALSMIGGEESMLALAGLLKSSDNKTVDLAKGALSSYNGDISYTLASVFESSSDAGKIAILQLIANRQMESQYNLVYNQLFTDNKSVKDEAAKTLSSVVSSKNLSDLFTLLEQSDKAYIPSMQKALNKALSFLSADDQLKQITERMNKSSNKYLYYEALANTGSQEAMNVLTKAYATSTGQNKSAAFDALASWKSFNVIYSLLDILRNSTSKEEKSKSVDAVVALIKKSNVTGAVKSLYLQEVMGFAETDQQKNNIISLLGATGMYQSLLFVAPFMNQPTLSESAAQAAMNLAINNPDFAGKETTEILEKVSKTLNNPDADYQRQSITKYLNENSKDGGYVSMFNGKNLDGWKGLVENPIKRSKMSKKDLAAAQVKADKQAAIDWIVEDGNIIFTGKGFDNLCTDKQYGDFEMLVDWKLYSGPEPDAGIYLRGTPQVQIWDTARVNVGAQVGSGGLYNNQSNPSKPLKVADQKVGEWNTFKIKMVGDRVSVWLNGELVTDNVILENYWDRSQPIFPVEQIELQAHGSKVAYRNLFIKEIKKAEPFKLSDAEEKEGFKVLFDGTNMHSWTGNTKDYVLEDGNIVIYPSQNFGGNLYTKDQYDNFVFRFEFQLTPGANNGLGIRTPMEGDAAYQGMELQILDNESPIYKDLQVYQYHGSVYGVIPAKRGFLKPTGEWNYQEVIANGDNIKVTLNGETILEGNIREAAKNGTADGREHPGLFNKTGHIGFLGHGSIVKFRNIRIKGLK
ncbi:MAG: DUF1080 domain-containing protein [Dysgonamonadaceae bacterium]|jgi:HEAT repeat protein|nr:DUF1080 domain-containing protein [Dysgonamonadaceae bacterium]MDD3309175.1 DUF1080 domain-containing protein [Dysgonamonadaceae bacterium]MDD3899723.1 DUF1080 domain-containing protein [Dysgonamonadaceae bacterium]MDD4397998.1 DUF1080 domain-containing protein [Dysgonamonadaceae bacterium]MEA5081633.1 DUF1080 domain-containing protein [Dysgonamonadaceae bacterium]